MAMRDGETGEERKREPVIRKQQVFINESLFSY